ncbi:GGDEF domain-containing protein [Dyella jiangningensis]|jgi:diguanylate cyclase (GGDEF)-like protein|uniref:GGDEF domain-containing protein n=1 Tax=Dyella jiangningensis TaxID=1379159 RepID=UPI00240F33F0|nr:diguanylate cyclase [Dyella jiangningensis]
MGESVYRKPIAVFVVCLLAALYALVLHAAPTPAHEAQLQIASLPASASTLPAEQIVHGALDASFVPSSSPYTPNAADARRWYRLTTDIDWNHASPPVLSFTGATYIRITVYAPPDYEPQALWFAQTEGIHRFSRHHLAVQLPESLRAGQPIYAEIASDSFTRQIKPMLTDMAHYQAEDLAHVRLTTLFASVQFTMILAAMCLWLVLRDRVLSYFIGYATFQLVYQMLMSGEIYELPVGGLFVPLGTRAPWLFATLSAPLSMSFILEFCDLREITPKAAKIMGWMRWPFLPAALLIWMPFAVRTNTLVNSFNLWFMITSIWSLGTVVLAALRHGRQARFFLIAWMPQVLLTLLRVLQILLKLDLPPWLEYGYPFTMAFSCVVVTIGLADLSLRARRERDMAHHLADHDALTGVLNRRALVRRLHAAIAEARLHNEPLALLFLDMDHFKSVNDRYGHQVGDACLRAVAEAIGDELRPTDWLGRYGGEEFVACLPGASHDNAMHIGERIRHRIETLQVHSRGTTLQTTISMGVASLGDHTDTADELIARADAALYRAKVDGRNRIVAHAHLAATSH